MKQYEERTYRSLINKENLLSCNVKIEESDLLVSSNVDLADAAFKSLAGYRHSLTAYIKKNPEFQKSMLPLAEDPLAPPIVRDMLAKSNICGVGPMAGVAGAVSEFVAGDLLHLTDNLIIENGGDIFLKTKNNDIMVSVFAGESPLSYKVNFMIKAKDTPLGVCTSSATVGPSISFGKADAVCVISKSATLADAAASAIGNRVKSKKEIKAALEYGINISGVIGIIIIMGKDMGAIGEVQLV